jgi:hypothetical protein
MAFHIVNRSIVALAFVTACASDPTSSDTTSPGPNPSDADESVVEVPAAPIRRSIGVSTQSVSGVSSVNTSKYGAVCDGKHDDRAAIQAALNSGNAEVVVQSGTCLVTTANANAIANLVVPAGVTLRGLAGATLLQAASSGPDARLLYVTGAGTTIRDLVLDSAAQTAAEHRSGIFAKNAPDLTIDSVIAHNFSGDGFYIYDRSNNFAVRNVVATGNHRNGLTLGGGTTGGSITRSTFSGNTVQQLDSEGGPIFDLTISGNTLDGGGVSNDFVLTISGVTDTHSARWSVENNTINGAIGIVWADDIAIRNNTGVSPAPKGSIYAERAMSRVAVEGNDFTAPAADTVIKFAGTGTGSAPRSVSIRNNHISGGGRFGVRVEGAISVAVTGNAISGTSAAKAGGTGVYLRATNPAEAFVLAAVTDNVISGWNSGVYVAGNGAAALNQLVACYNTFTDPTGVMTAAAYLDADRAHAARSIAWVGNSLGGKCTTELGGIQVAMARSALMTACFAQP